MKLNWNSIIVPVLFILLIALYMYMNKAQGKVTDSCECPKLECGSCEEQQGVTFYSEKCDNGNRVKSCAKPTCTAMDPLPDHCPKVVKGTTPERAIASEQKAIKQEMKAMAELPQPAESIGQVSRVKGKAWLLTPAGEKKLISRGYEVREKDIIYTAKKAFVKVKFKSGNTINLMPSSRLLIKKFTLGKKKKTLIELLKGKVRSKVNTKVDNDSASYFRVKTKSAVAGVRGTDFVVSYEEKDHIVTKIETIKGQVELASGDGKQKQEIGKGEAASFVIANNSNQVFTDEEISEFVARGYMTPVYKMTGKEIARLNKSTEILDDSSSSKRMPASQGQHICKGPKGHLNQCAWRCKNNPTGEGRCRTDLPKVNCVRYRCNANGDWAEQMRLPSSYHESCKPSGWTVKDCDY